MRTEQEKMIRDYQEQLAIQVRYFLKQVHGNFCFHFVAYERVIVLIKARFHYISYKTM